MTTLQLDMDPRVAALLAKLQQPEEKKKEKTQEEEVPFKPPSNFEEFVKVEKLVSTVKPVLSSHLKIDKTKVLKPCGSSMQVESIAECSPLGAFCNICDLH